MNARTGDHIHCDRPFCRPGVFCRSRALEERYRLLPAAENRDAFGQLIDSRDGRRRTAAHSAQFRVNDAVRLTGAVNVHRHQPVELLAERTELICRGRSIGYHCRRRLRGGSLGRVGLDLRLLTLTQQRPHLIGVE